MAFWKDEVWLSCKWQVASLQTEFCLPNSLLESLTFCHCVKSGITDSSIFSLLGDEISFLLEEGKGAKQDLRTMDKQRKSWVHTL